jgi:hypothetical protein
LRVSRVGAASSSVSNLLMSSDVMLSPRGSSLRPEASSSSSNTVQLDDDDDDDDDDGASSSPSPPQPARANKMPATVDSDLLLNSFFFCELSGNGRTEE